MYELPKKKDLCLLPYQPSYEETKTALFAVSEHKIYEKENLKFSFLTCHNIEIVVSMIKEGSLLLVSLH